MPEQAQWEAFFDVPGILDAFGFGPGTRDVVELGCGYGVHPAAGGAYPGTVHTIDIDEAMVAATRARAVAAGCASIAASVRDFASGGFGVAPRSADAALLFNILHADDPVFLLWQARQAIRPAGLVAVIHWRSDIPTPRGPSPTIRPRAEQVQGWAATAGLARDGGPFMLPPWHYGLKLRRL